MVGQRTYLNFVALTVSTYREFWSILEYNIFSMGSQRGSNSSHITNSGIYSSIIYSSLAEVNHPRVPYKENSGKARSRIRPYLFTPQPNYQRALRYNHKFAMIFFFKYPL